VVKRNRKIQRRRILTDFIRTPWRPSRTENGPVEDFN